MNFEIYLTISPNVRSHTSLPRDDVIRDAEAAHNPSEEANGGVGGDLGDGHGLHPFGELVDDM